jgi:hypothetical protein
LSDAEVTNKLVYNERVLLSRINSVKFYWPNTAGGNVEDEKMYIKWPKIKD